MDDPEFITKSITKKRMMREAGVLNRRDIIDIRKFKEWCDKNAWQHDTALDYFTHYNNVYNTQKSVGSINEKDEFDMEGYRAYIDKLLKFGC
jgi:hypothetical protein